jgi:hypothetical protein
VAGGGAGAAARAAAGDAAMAWLALDLRGVYAACNALLLAGVERWRLQAGDRLCVLQNLLQMMPSLQPCMRVLAAGGRWYCLVVQQLSCVNVLNAGMLSTGQHCVAKCIQSMHAWVGLGVYLCWRP